MTLGEKIRTLRKKKEMSQDKLARTIGVSLDTVSRWETGKHNPRTEDLTKMASVFGMSLPELLKEEHEELPAPNGNILNSITSVPLISDKVLTACCGNGTGYATEVEWEVEREYPFPAADLMGYGWQGADFRLIVASGASMEPYISDGDMILFASGVEVEAGDLAVVSVNNRVFVKGVVQMERDHILFRSYNWQVSPDINVELNDNNEVYILGKVVEVIAKKKFPRMGF